jgi:hypothetical protein
MGNSQNDLVRKQAGREQALPWFQGKDGLQVTKKAAT